MLSFLVEHAQASVVVFDNCDAYDMVTNALGIGNESLDFTTYDDSFPSLDVDSSVGSVELSASSGLQVYWVRT